MSPAAVGGQCLHAQPSPVGYTEMPVQRADAAVAGLVLFAGVHYCPDCSGLVVSVHLRPKTPGSAPVLATVAPTALMDTPFPRPVGRGGRAVAS